MGPTMPPATSHQPEVGFAGISRGSRSTPTWQLDLKLDDTKVHLDHLRRCV